MADAWDPRYGPHPRAQHTGKTDDPSRPGGLPGRDGPRHGKFDPVTGSVKSPDPVAQESRLQQYVVPNFFAGVDPATIAYATNKAARVQVRNIGAAVVVLSLVIGDIGNPNGPTGAVFQLPIGDRDVFVLSPGQTLYAIASAPGGIVSVAFSTAVSSD